MDNNPAPSFPFSKEMIKALSDQGLLLVHSYYIDELKQEIDSYPDDAVSIFRKLTEIRQSDDRLAAILLGSLIEDQIQSEFKRVFVAKSQDIFTDPQAPLSTTSARLKLAYGLEWIDETTYKAVSKIRRIRNEFAHNFAAKKFNDNKVRQYVQSLYPAENRIYDGDTAKDPTLKLKSEFDLRDIFLVRGIFIFGDLLMALRYRPLAYRRQVPANSMYLPNSRPPMRIAKIMAATLLVCADQLKRPDAGAFYSDRDDEQLNGSLTRVAEAAQAAMSPKDKALEKK